MSVQSSGVSFVSTMVNRLSGLHDVNVGYPQTGVYLRFDTDKWIGRTIDLDVAQYLTTQVSSDRGITLTADPSRPSRIILSLARVNDRPGPYGTSFKIPRITVNEYGQVTGVTEHDVDLSSVTVPTPDFPEVQVFGDVTGLITTTGVTTLTLGDTGVDPGTYVRATFSIDSKGRIIDIEDGGDIGVETFNSRTGDISLTSRDVTDALGFTPYDATVNPLGFTGNNGIVESVSGQSSNGFTVSATGNVRDRVIAVKLSTTNGLLKSVDGAATIAEPGVDYITLDSEGELTNKTLSAVSVSSTSIEVVTEPVVNVDHTLGNATTITITGDTELNISIPDTGRYVEHTLRVIADGSTVTWDAAILFEEEPVLLVDKTYIIKLVSFGDSKWYGKTEMVVETA